MTMTSLLTNQLVVNGLDCLGTKYLVTGLTGGERYVTDRGEVVLFNFITLCVKPSKNQLYIASDTLTSSPGAANILMFVIEQLVLLDLQKHTCIGSSSIEKKIISR